MVELLSSGCVEEASFSGTGDTTRLTAVGRLPKIPDERSTLAWVKMGVSIATALERADARSSPYEAPTKSSSDTLLAFDLRLVDCVLISTGFGIKV